MRERVLDAAEAMVQERGLAAVSFQQLADAVGLSKASVFHHFPNKDEMAKALVDRCRTKYRAGYDAVIESDAPAPEKLERIAKLFDDGLQENRLCLLNSLGQSISILSDDVQSELRVSAIHAPRAERSTASRWYSSRVAGKARSPSKAVRRTPRRAFSLFSRACRCCLARSEITGSSCR